MSIFYNIMSLLLGCIALALPIIAIVTRRYRSPFPTASYGLICVSLLFQLMEARHRIQQAATVIIDDPINTVIGAAVLLLCLVTVLNIGSYVVNKVNH